MEGACLVGGDPELQQLVVPWADCLIPGACRLLVAVLHTVCRQYARRSVSVSGDLVVQLFLGSYVRAAVGRGTVCRQCVRVCEEQHASEWQSRRAAVFSEQQQDMDAGCMQQ